MVRVFAGGTRVRSSATYLGRSLVRLELVDVEVLDDVYELVVCLVTIMVEWLLSRT